MMTAMVFREHGGPDVLHLEELPIQWSASQSGVDLDEGGFDRLASKGVHADYDFVIEPGEMLFLPFGWWHRVETLTTSVAANFWWWTLPMIVTHSAPVVRALTKLHGPQLLATAS